MACSLDTSLPEVSEDDFDEFMDSARAEALPILKELFPDLDEDILLEISAELSYEEVLALRAELEEIRTEAAKFSLDLFKTSQERVEERAQALEPENDGYPTELSAVGRLCTYDEARGRGQVLLSGVFEGKHTARLESSAVRVFAGEQQVDGQLSCIAADEPVDIVFLIDITGSMSSVIASVRDSVVRFVDAIEASGVEGTLSVVTFQDSVGVNVTFQEPAPEQYYERSPFFSPVAISDGSQVDELRSFVNRLEANRGADAPENLAGAIDFARSGVIGQRDGQPNVIGDGIADPVGTEPFPQLPSARQVFVVLTDSTFHGDDRDSSNSSLDAAFVPRSASVIAESLVQTNTVVHVSDPSWRDDSLDPKGGKPVDADFWAIQTGGVGEDTTLGYSLVDLELVAVAEDTGLLDIALDDIISTSCSFSFSADLTGLAEVDVELQAKGQTVIQTVPIARY